MHWQRICELRWGIRASLRSVWASTRGIVALVRVAAEAGPGLEPARPAPGKCEGSSLSMYGKLAGVVISFDSAAAPGTAEEAAAVVDAVLAASAADELDWIEWKSSLDLSNKTVGGLSPATSWEWRTGCRSVLRLTLAAGVSWWWGGAWESLRGPGCGSG